MDKFLKKYSINEVSKKTHISPLALKALLNKDFSKIDYIKLKGFIKILENEYKDVDFSEIKKEIEDFHSNFSQKIEEKEIIKEETQSNFKTYFLVFILLIIISGLIFYMQNMQKKEIKHHKANIEPPKIEFVVAPEKKDNKVEENSSNFEKLESKKTDLLKEEETNKTIIEKKENNYTLAIVPNEKVWLKVFYLDDNSSKEYLTSNEIDLNGSRNLFIKFGHGDLKLFYDNKVIDPKTKKVLRVILKNNELNITKKRLKEFR